MIRVGNSSRLKWVKTMFCLFFRVSLTEKFASYYGNLRGLLLGSNLTGRRANPDNIFPEEAQLTAYKKEKDKDNKEGR